MCPSSNVQTGSVTDLANHPLRFYFDFGLRVSVNTDNRLITDTTLTRELTRVHRELGFEIEDIATLIVQGFKSAFLPFREKSELLREVNQEIAAVLARFAGSGPGAGRRSA
jgi:adenosine deaminase